MIKNGKYLFYGNAEDPGVLGLGKGSHWDGLFVYKNTMVERRDGTMMPFKKYVCKLKVGIVATDPTAYIWSTWYEDSNVPVKLIQPSGSNVKMKVVFGSVYGTHWVHYKAYKVKELLKKAVFDGKSSYSTSQNIPGLGATDIKITATKIS